MSKKKNLKNGLKKPIKIRNEIAKDLWSKGYHHRTIDDKREELLIKELEKEKNE